MWRSHLYAEPPNAPLFYGPFATDPILYTQPLLEGFDAWLGVGQVLTAPQLFQGGLTRKVYFPRSSPADRSLYFDLHAPFATHRAGEWATVGTPLEHAGLFAREGAVVPIGKDMATVTALSGPPRTHTDGVDVVLDTDHGGGGQVGADDWRGVMIFPGPATAGSKSKSSSYSGEWIEDDGISSEPVGTCRVRVSYTSGEEIGVEVGLDDRGFKPLWAWRLHVVLPAGDKRVVSGATRTVWNGRDAWLLDFSD